ncbi:hypothetical protein DFH09DRAFT_925352, partial [Mycena vulgaris]
AQREIDAVVGHDRLPNFEDKDSLPYIRAIIKETLRWRPVSPLGEYPFSQPNELELSCMKSLAVPRRTTGVAL